MVYIRVKKIKGREYAYLVNTKWLKTRKQAKQSVSKYLGRVFAYEKKKDIDFLEHAKAGDAGEFLNGKGKNELITALAAWEFEKYGITGIKVNDDLKVMCGRKEVTIKLNDGFMNTYTLQELYNFKKQKTEDDAIEMAKRFVGAGIAIPKELFIEVFSSNIFK